MINNNDIQRTFFVALLIAVTAAFVWLIKGFIQPIFWAVALGIVFYPIHTRINNKLKNRPTIAATISVLGVLLVVVLPIIGITIAVTTEAGTLYQQLRGGDFSLTGIYASLIERFPVVESTLQRVGIDAARISEQLGAIAATVSRFIANWALEFGQDTLRIVVFFFLMLYLLFFFLKDGQRILENLVHALPFGDARERLLLARFAEVSRATIKGSLFIGIAQGAIGGITFAMLGLGAPALWGVVMALLSIIPAVGPALIWLPAAIFLLATERIISGIILLLIGAVVISLVDNLLRPILVGRDTRMPDYLILLSTLGGLTAFGLAGVVIGPIIAAFFLTVWEMAVDEFEDVAN